MLRPLLAAGTTDFQADQASNAVWPDLMFVWFAMNLSISNMGILGPSPYNTTVFACLSALFYVAICFRLLSLTWPTSTFRGRIRLRLSQVFILNRSAPSVMLDHVHSIGKLSRGRQSTREAVVHADHATSSKLRLSLLCDIKVLWSGVR